jgi:hypothetical protein
MRTQRWEAGRGEGTLKSWTVSRAATPPLNHIHAFLHTVGRGIKKTWLSLIQPCAYM